MKGERRYGITAAPEEGVAVVRLEDKRTCIYSGKDRDFINWKSYLLILN